jgi:hypothetical protein
MDEPKRRAAEQGVAPGLRVGARDRADRTRQITRIVAREIPTAGAALTRGAVARLVLQRQAYDPRPQALGQCLVRPPARGGAIPFKQLMATFGSAGAGR